MYHILMGISRRIMDQVTKRISSQTGFWNTTISSLYSQQSPESADVKPTKHIWDVPEWLKYSHRSRVADKSVATV